MKKVICALLVCTAIGSMGASLLVSQIQAAVDSAMVQLKLEVVPTNSGLTGKPTTYKVTKRTIDHLTKLMDTGRTITVDSSGTIRIERAAK